MNAKSFNRKLFSFLAKSTSPYHAVRSISDIFQKYGFKQLNQKDTLNFQKGQPYYVIREDGSIAAFNFGLKDEKGFRILGSHSDSPCLQIKPNPDLNDKKYHKLGVEVYGGALLNPWFDRELSIAGRVTYLNNSNSISSSLIDFKRPVGVIPSLAIHLDRSANNERKINPQKDIIPIVGHLSQKNRKFIKILKKTIHQQIPQSKVSEILSFDLFFYDYHTPCYSGFENDFILSSRLDNLLSCFIAASAIAKADTNHNFMFICNNHEEVGSNTASGAQGNFLISLFESLFADSLQMHAALAQSYLISLDNAHASHPNFPEKHDSSHDIFLNHGPVLKINANHRYASSGLSNSIFKVLCKESGVKVQEFVMRNDLACGSTIGPMTAAKLGVKAVDVGAATLAMHSIRELTGSHDPLDLYKVIVHFLNRDTIPEIHQCC